MKSRPKLYKHYAHVTVCEDWQPFEGFRRDMEKDWFQGAILDRIDNEKGYSKSNCRWVSVTESLRNRRNVKVTPELARHIRYLKETEGRKNSQIAAQFHLGHRTVSNIILYKQWL